MIIEFLSYRQVLVTRLEEIECISNVHICTECIINVYI